MALIKCPECGKEVSDKAKQCPNCGCPISSESTNQPVVVKEEKVVEDVVYYNKTIDGIQCKLTSSLWRFGDNITIPVKSISAVVRKQFVMPLWWKIVIWLMPTIAYIVEMATTMGYYYHIRTDSWQWEWQGWIDPFTDFIVLFGGVGLLFYLPSYLMQHDKIEVISHSGVRTSAIKYRHINDDLAPLYEAALKCLKENT